MRLTHWRIARHVQRLEQAQTSVRWLDLYAAQAMMTRLSDCKARQDRELERSTVDFLVACSAASVFGFDALPVAGERYLKFAERMLSQGLKLPDEEQLEPVLKQLASSGLLQTAMEEQSDAGYVSDSPLVLAESCVFLRRLWEQHDFLNGWLKRQEQVTSLNLDQVRDSRAHPEFLQGSFKCLFPATDPEQTVSSGDFDWQALAAAQALTQNVCLISGGPGTGKTSTAARILILYQLQGLQDLPSGVESMRIRLLAPTGKAAVRLHTSVVSQYPSLLAKLNLDEDLAGRLKASLPRQGETIHRALMEVSGKRSRDGGLSKDTFIDSGQLLSGEMTQATLDADIVLVDEASMIDRKLMQDLLAIVPLGNPDAEASGCRLLFLGDHYQLPPVECGEVFAQWVRRYADRPFSQSQVAAMSFFYPAVVEQVAVEPVSAEACSGEAQAPSLLAQLHKTYRFDGPIQVFAQALRRGRLPPLTQLLPETSIAGRSDVAGDLFSPATFTWVDLGLAGAGEEGASRLAQAMENVLEGYRNYFDKVDQGLSPAQLMEEKLRFQVLCATYEGPLGVNMINRLVEKRFGRGEFYHGKVIMVTGNQPALDLFNGDLGILTAIESQVTENKAESATSYLVHFPDKNNQDEGVALSMIHAWQTAYAISIHKSQGSEYEQVTVFAPDYAGELLSSRLVYTGVTRAQRNVELWISRQTLLAQTEP